MLKLSGEGEKGESGTTYILDLETKEEAGYLYGSFLP